jgi:hypothetical protein
MILAIEINAFTIVSFVFITLVQHESAVVLWYTTLLPFFEHWHHAAVAAFAIISVIDLLWLYSLFFVMDKSFHRLARIPVIHRWIEQLRTHQWFVTIISWFLKNGRADRPDRLAQRTSGSRFKRFLSNSGYIGIVLCAATPGPGLKEIGILMALTPKYKGHGFKLMYFGGMIKTIMTMVVYGGLFRVLQSLFAGALT